MKRMDFKTRLSEEGPKPPERPELHETHSETPSSSSPTLPRKAPEETTQKDTSKEPPYKVILHNDDYTPMEHVVEVLQKVVPRVSARKAVDIMMEAHKNGKAVVVKCHRELAELYQEGLMNEGLICSVEPD